MIKQMGMVNLSIQKEMCMKVSFWIICHMVMENRFCKMEPFIPVDLKMGKRMDMANTNGWINQNIKVC